MSEMSTPTLYKIDSKGVTRVWRSWSTLNDDGSAVENNENGIDGGVLSGIPITVMTGKNIGKRNETTPLQQVNKRIESKYAKKLREGYVTDIKEYTQQGVMSAHEWKVSKHRMPSIALHQPKLDGIRCKAIKDSSGSSMLMSKSNKEFKPFLYETSWANWFNQELEPLEEVDGEMYIHGLTLNEIASLVMAYKLNQEELLELCSDTPDGLRINLNAKQILELVYTGIFQPEPEVKEISSGVFSRTGRIHADHHAIEIGKNSAWVFPGFTVEDVTVLGTSDLEYWAFDCPDSESSAEERNMNLDNRLNSEYTHASKIRTVTAVEFSIADIAEVNAEHVANGFEGTMVRNPAGLYAFGQRSADLQKYKLFHDAEWVITGHDLDAEGNPTFTFVSDAGIPFSSRPTGDRAWRAKLLSDMEDLVGKRATIRYQMLYPDTLVPQFGRCIAIRDYE